MDLDDLDPEPHTQFDEWFAEASAAGVTHPEQIALATATPQGVPSVRMVLLKAHDVRGFVFYTNLESRKAAELELNPRAAIVVHWELQGRQVRVEGAIERVSESEASIYFATRPRGSTIGAWASPQSHVIATRAELEQRLEEIEDRFRGVDVLPLPPFWGGYRLVASAIEFWQGQPNRLHDRVRYELQGGNWLRARLAP